MEKKIKALILAVSLFMVLPVLGKEKGRYVPFVNQIVDSFSKKMEKKYDLVCSGSGGQMPKDIEMITVKFACGHPADLSTVRELEVIGVEKLICEINSSKDIKPYLRESPFKSNRINLTFSFYNYKSNSYQDGIAYASIVRDQIVY